MASPVPKHLQPSKLGTKEYWDDLYTTELANQASDPSDKGTVWFDDADAEARVCGYLESITESASFDHEVRREDASFLDLGCGNGSLLLALRDEGWRGAMVGVDYSTRSVELARRVARARAEGKLEGNDGDGDDVGDDYEEKDAGMQDNAKQQQQDEAISGAEAEDDVKDPEFLEWDVLRGDLSVALAPIANTTTTTTTAAYDVVLDKGTFDAVCLSSDLDAATGRRACEGYRARVLRLVKPHGLFLVTSCNWTEEELRAWFEAGGGGQEGNDAARLVTVGRVTYPSFQFGGAKGQAISTLCFRKDKW